MAKKVSDGQQTLLSDGANYHKMSAPFETVEEAQRAANAFCEELYELRNKHRIKDTFIVLEVFYEDGDGETCGAQSAFHFGSGDVAIKLAAFGYGQERAAFNEKIARLTK